MDKGRMLSRALLGAISALVALGAAPAYAQTVVSLTFDEGTASQYSVRPALSAHGMHGTFFVSTGEVGTNSYYMSWAQLHGLADDGNEIGGRTVDGVRLTTLSADDARHQVCDDRTALLSQGFSVSSFSYPNSARNAAVEGIVAGCGYTVGRPQGGIYDPVECTGCPVANALPPGDPLNVRSTEYLSHAYTLDDLEGWVTRAEAAGGGWVPIVFGDVCDNCGASSVSPSTFAAFLDWLGARQAQGTVVQTVREAVPPADGTPPRSTLSCDGGSCPDGSQTPVSVSLAATDSGSGVSSTHYTTDGSVPTLSSPTYTAPFTVAATTTVRFRSWDNAGNVEPVQTQSVRIITGPTTVSLTFDDGAESQMQARPILTANGLHATFFINSAEIGANSYYMTWDQVHALAADGNEIGGHTLDHPDLTSLSATDAQHEVCDDRAALRAQGFTVTSFAYPFSRWNPTVTGIVQTCGYTVARGIGGLSDPVDCIGCPFSNTLPVADPLHVKTPAWQTGQFTLPMLESWVTQSEDHGGGWVPIVFHDICDACGDSTVSASTLQAFLGWLAQRSSFGTTVKTMRDAGPPPDLTAPVTTIACNGGACAPWSRTPVTVTLSATDAGTGVTATRYTTDGTDPTESSPAYTAPLTVSATTTIKFRSWDLAGNAEAVRTQKVGIDTTAPGLTVRCAGGACTTGWYAAPLAVTAVGTDAESGIDSIHYTTDNSTPTLSSPLYTGALSLPGSDTLRFRAWDAVGNAGAVVTQSFRIDGTDPVTTIRCDGKSCSPTTTYKSPLKVTFDVSDSQSGVASTHYTTDGSVPTLASPLYTNGFNLNATTTITYRSWDRAGNSETARSIRLSVRR